MLFMGVHGVTVDAGLTTPNLLEAETEPRADRGRPTRVVVVADHTKWGIRGLSRIADLDEADVFVTDAGLDRRGARGARASTSSERDRSPRPSRAARERVA